MTNHASPSAPTMPTRTEVAIAGYVGDASTAVIGLSANDPQVRAGALSALQRRGALSADIVQKALVDDSPVVVRRAVEVAASVSLDDPEIDERLLVIVDSDNDVLVEVTAWCLGERHQESATPLAQRVVTTLSRLAIAHPEALVREAAVASLGSIGHRSGLEAVLKATTDKATVRRRAVIALAAFEGPEVDSALQRARTDRDWQVRQAAEDLSN